MENRNISFFWFQVLPFWSLPNTSFLWPILATFNLRMQLINSYFIWIQIISIDTITKSDCRERKFATKSLVLQTNKKSDMKLEDMFDGTWSLYGFSLLCNVVLAGWQACKSGCAAHLAPQARRRLATVLECQARQAAIELNMSIENGRPRPFWSTKVDIYSSKNRCSKSRCAGLCSCARVADIYARTAYKFTDLFLSAIAVNPAYFPLEIGWYIL